MTDQQRLTDHERRISTIEGTLSGMAADISEIKSAVTDGKGSTCSKHAAYISSQWWHIRAIWGVLGTALLFILGKVKNWF